MSNDWMDKAKGMAKQAAEEAKKLADSAKSANYGEMFDKTKNMAMRAADEAKKAAGSVMNKEKDTTDNAVVENYTVVTTAPTTTPTTTTSTEQGSAIVAKLEQVENLLNEIKRMLPLK